MSQSVDWKDTMGPPIPAINTPSYDPWGISMPTTATPGHASMLCYIFSKLIEDTHAVKLLADSKADLALAFAVAESRGNISDGDSLDVALGKLAKWYSDLQAVAWSGKYADLNDIPNSFPPSDHSHDIRYYTKEESNTQLSNKANVSGAHSPRVTPSSHDLNDMTLAGTYNMGTVALYKNYPPNAKAWTVLETVGNTYLRQIVTEVFSGNTYMRARTDGGSWSSWKQLATAEPPQEFALPLSSGISRTASADYWKDQFHQVHINLVCTSSVQINNGSTLAVIPQGFRPKKRVTVPITFLKYGFPRRIEHADINENGAIVFWGFSSSDFGDGGVDVIAISPVCYIAND